MVVKEVPATKMHHFSAGIIIVTCINEGGRFNQMEWSILNVKHNVFATCTIVFI